jgi:hypothetical protein
MPILEEVVETYLRDLRLNADLIASGDWLACVLPVGDGIAVAARRGG